MDPQQVLTYGQQGLFMLLTVAAPVLLTVMGVGLLVSIFQAATQIHEATMSFVPKILAAVAMLAMAGPWMLTSLVDYLQRMLMAIPDGRGLRPSRAAPAGAVRMLTFTEAQMLAWVTPILWPFLRVLALLGAMPVIAQRSVPARYRVALAFFIALCAQGALPPMPVVALDSAAALLLLIQQVLIGLSLGFAVRIVFTAIELAGELTGLQMGLNLAGFFDPASGGADHRRQPLLRHRDQLAVHRHQRPPADDRRRGAELHGLPGRARTLRLSAGHPSLTSGAARSSASACGSLCR